MSDMQILSPAAVSVMVEGTSKLERQMSVISSASQAALQACLGMKGKAGVQIRSQASRYGLVDIAAHAASGNYKPLAEFLAIRLGEPVLISSRSTFEALPDFFQARVHQAELGKNGGMRVDAKTGALVPGAKLAEAQEMQLIVTKVIERCAQIHAERKARAAAEAEARAKLEAGTGGEEVGQFPVGAEVKAA